MHGCVLQNGSMLWCGVMVSEVRCGRMAVNRRLTEVNEPDVSGSAGGRGRR